MKNFKQLNKNMKEEGSMRVDDDDVIVIEDEFSASEDSYDRQFYQQLVSESVSNDGQEHCEPSTDDLPIYKNIESEDIVVKEEYFKFEDSVDRDFYLQLIAKSLPNDVQDCQPNNNSREYDSSKSTHTESDEEIDIGSTADNNPITHTSPTFPASDGIKTRLRARRPARHRSLSSSSDTNISKRRKKKQQQTSSEPRKRVKPIQYVSEPDVGRLEHNVKERQRRGDLRHAFTELRLLVPAVLADERSSKVDILNHASAYCHHLQMEFQARQKLVVELCRYQKRLRHRVEKLMR